MRRFRKLNYLGYWWEGDPVFWRKHTYMVEWELWYANGMKGPMPMADHKEYWRERLRANI